jgi:two-component system chemotaxis response regulator CheB
MSVNKEETIKVLVVDDSAFMRRVITDILQSDRSIIVVDTAKDGREALQKIAELNPDVVTLDVEMPILDGLSCLKEILQKTFLPVVMLSSLTMDGADATIKALEDGAVDFITKPTNIFDMKSDDKKQEIIDKVKVAKKANKIKREPIINIKTRKSTEFTKSSNLKNIVAIGTSTGGPKALQSVIPLIPGDAPAAYLVVQHMPPGFTKSLAERLNSMSEVTVKEAEDGEIIKPGTVYIAPGDYHMLTERIQSGDIRIKLTQTPPVGGHRPAVNVMMESLSETGLKNIVGVIMTGMGGDGSEGIKKLKSKNEAYTIAQDEKSCVVYGMPKVALMTGAVDIVVPLKDITGEIMKFIGGYK